MIIIEKKENCTDYDALLTDMAKRPPGKYQLTLKKVRDPRTRRQNAWLWGTIYPMLLEGLNDIGYELTDTKQVHRFCKDVFSDKYINKHTGEIIQIPDSTKEMDTVVFSTYIQVIREWASEFLYLEIPDPPHDSPEDSLSNRVKI